MTKIFFKSFQAPSQHVGPLGTPPLQRTLSPYIPNLPRLY